MKRLVWLASYPKSGNTWMRMLLSAYQQDRDKNFEIDDAFRSTISASRRATFLRVANKQELDVPQIDSLREAVQRSIAQTIKPPILLKTHDACVQHNGFPVIRKELTLGAIYVIRNPLDVVDSFADHMGLSTDGAITAMNNPRFSIGGKDAELVPQYLQTWSNHVRTWTEHNNFPVHVIRYEDLHAAPHFAFRNALNFLGWDVDSRRLKHAIQASSFSNLKQQEERKGFAERSQSSRSGRFFRNGKTGNWSETLTPEQIQQIVSMHGPVMEFYGYHFPYQSTDCSLSTETSNIKKQTITH